MPFEKKRKGQPEQTGFGDQLNQVGGGGSAANKGRFYIMEDSLLDKSASKFWVLGKVDSIKKKLSMAMSKD